MAQPFPRHVAIIMDGNGRWAQRRRRPRVFGHIRGSRRIRAIVEEAGKMGIQVLTLYAFSTENWSREESELSVLWRLLGKYLRREVESLDRSGVSLHVIGETERLSPDLRELLSSTMKRLSKNTGLKLVLALSYGSRREMASAMSAFARDCAEGRRSPQSLDEKGVGEYLYTSFLGGQSDVDLVIRTSGEKRVSNFLLWQAAYAEFVFLDECWPDFTPASLRGAVAEFQGRERRFGAVRSPEASL